MNEPAHDGARYERGRNQRERTAKRKKQSPVHPPAFTLPNRKSEFATVEEENEFTQQTTHALCNLNARKALVT
ncbi:MAG: hypothetical protein R6U91_07920 [Bacillota bacterium]